MEKLLLSRQEAAALLSVSLRHLVNLINAGRLPTRRLGRRVLISRAALESFAKRDHPLPARGRADQTTEEPRS